MSHIKIVKNDMKNVDNQVKNLFHLTDQEFGNITYNLGVIYLNYLLVGDDFSIKQLEKSKLFWSWWMLQMYQSNKTLLRHSSVIAPTVIKSDGCILNSPEMRRDFYDIYHQDRWKPILPKVVYDELNIVELESIKK